MLSNDLLRLFFIEWEAFVFGIIVVGIAVGVSLRRDKSMFYRVTSWPKIIAAFVGGIGLGGMCSAWELTSSGSTRALITCNWWVIVASALLLILSYPLAIGCEWARRTLLLAGAVIGVSLVEHYFVGAISPIHYTDLSPEEAKVVQLWDHLGSLSLCFLILSLLVFGVLLLSHPDIVKSFRGRRRSTDKA